MFGGHLFFSNKEPINKKEARAKVQQAAADELHQVAKQYNLLTGNIPYFPLHFLLFLLLLTLRVLI
jgi:hypothetical protein